MVTSKLLWGLPDKMLGGNLLWTSNPSMGSRNTLSRFILQTFFKTRGYPDPVIHNSKHCAKSIHPQSAPLSSHNKLEERIPLTLTFHPHNISVKNIILKNFKLLQHDPTTAEIFAQPLLISYKRDKNLSNFLVQSTLKSDHQPGTFKCARVRCKTCPFISNANKISGLSELSPSLIITRAFPPISSIVLPVQSRKNIKQKFIFQIGTLSPCGINERFSFL